MRFSLSKLQQYFEKPLPCIEEVSEAITMHAFEVEAVEKKDDDVALEIKVLADRASDAKSELGLARELSAVLNQPLKAEYASFPSPETARAEIVFTCRQLNEMLGLDLNEGEILDFLRRGRLRVEKEGKKEFVAFVPPERQDLNLVEDLADEVGRLYGFDRIPAAPLAVAAKNPEPNKNFLLMNKVREFFVKAGFSEIYNYTFRDQGEVAVEKPLAKDKAFLRANLTDGLKRAIEFNLQRVLFEQEQVKLFEIGTVFIADAEEIHVASGVGCKKPQMKIDVNEGKLTDWTSQLAGIPANLNQFINPNIHYQPVSSYPRVIRDIAIFVPDTAPDDEVMTVIKDSAGSLLAAGPVLFDEFKKDGKKSLAFRLVFQSHERTLSDEEVNKIVAKIIAALESRPDFEVRK